MKKPNPSLTISIGIPAACACPASEIAEDLVVRLGGGRRDGSASVLPVEQLDLPADLKPLARAHAPGLVQALEVREPLGRDVFRVDRVARRR